ncbi:hypothetical protein U1Q18_031410, partial [Sarracenia purpurea var. burkii]
RPIKPGLNDSIPSETILLVDLHMAYNRFGRFVLLMIAGPCLVNMLLKEFCIPGRGNGVVPQISITDHQEIAGTDCAMVL